MVDHETLTYLVKRTPSQQPKTGDISLISQERTQKLDLLMHLLANLTQSLVLCGPEGIGKTTLLKVLQSRQVNSWLYCFVLGNSDSSFESILHQVAKTMGLDPQKSDQKLLNALSQYESQQKKIILMIDDSGELVPGLITTLVQFASAHPVLRIIFALTHDSLYVKNTTDRAIEDCHFIELPPLSEKHCGEFLRHLSAMPFPQVSVTSISDGLVEKIYRETHGIPGKIIDDLPKITKSKARFSSTAWLVFAVSALIALALALQWYSGSRFNKQKKPAHSKVSQQLTKSKIPLPAAKTPVQPSPADSIKQNEQGNSQTPPENKTDQAINASASSTGNVVAPPELDASKPTNQQALTAPPVVQPSQSQTTPVKALNSANVALSPAIPSDDSTQDASSQSAKDEIQKTNASKTDAIDPSAIEGFAWIASQPDENFTLQVMVLTKEQAVREVINKYPGLEYPLTYFKLVSPSGREKYQVIYGSFASQELANKAKQGLPVELRKSYSRSFSSIKAETARSR